MSYEIRIDSPAISGRFHLRAAFILLALLISSTYARAESHDWVLETVNSHIAETAGWPTLDYSINIISKTPDRILVRVNHKDDEEFGKLVDGRIRTGGGKSFDILIDPKTRIIIEEIRYQ